MMDSYIRIKVRSNAGKQEIIPSDTEKNTYSISVKSPAYNGKANIELLKILKYYFKNKKIKTISIIKGLKSKYKIIKITR